MKSVTSIFKTAAIASVLSVLAAGSAFAQQAGCDSTCGSRSLRGTPIVPLANQERETPQITNNSTTNVTQLVTQSATPDVFGVDSGWITSILGNEHIQGSGPWMVTGGHRACQAYGYASGYVVEYFGGGAQVACYR